MNTKFLMIISAVVMGLMGIALTFLPSEILHTLSGQTHPKELVLIIQMLGALYFGFAMINWMAKDNLIGGIYSRPIAVGNTCHYFIGAMALMNSGVVVLLPFTIIYGVMAASFFIVLFTHPVKAHS